MANGRNMIAVTAGIDLLERAMQQGGAGAWNDMIDRLFALNVICTTWNDNKPAPPLSITLDFSDSDLSNRNLDNFDLRYAWMPGCNLAGSSLRRAQFGFVQGCSFRGADLQGALFEDADITGCDFTDAKIAAMRFSDAWFEVGKPPIGLPEGVLDELRRFPKDAEADQQGVASDADMTFSARLIWV